MISCSPDASVKGLEGGIFTDTFKSFVINLTTDWKVIDVYRERAYEAIEFQYTYWPAPENRTARAQEFINVSTMAVPWDLLSTSGFSKLSV